MISVPTHIKVYIAFGYTDMRKSIDGLGILVEDQLELDPFSGNLYAFCNRNRTIIKVLYWDKNGFCIWQKRLEADKFKWPCTSDEVLHISNKELDWLLAGFEITKAHKEVKYSTLF